MSEPLSTPEDAVAFETGRQSVQKVNGRPLCDWHADRARELGGLADQIGRQTGLIDETQPHKHNESAPYRGQCADCAKGQATEYKRPWEDIPRPNQPRRTAPEKSDLMPFPQSWPNNPNRRTGPFTPLPQSMSYRVAVRRGQGDAGLNEVGFQRLAHQISADMPDVVVLRKIAHDSGDGQTIFHCFAGETRYITRDGVKSFAETAGTTQWVLTGSPDDSRGGFWIEAPIRELGVQKIWEVTLRRNRRTKTIRTTSGHRWLVRRPDRVVTTQSLKPGQRLAHLRAKQFDLALDAQGVRMGFVFGDGTIQHRESRTYGAVTLWADKRALAKYFDEIATQPYPVQTDGGIPGLRYTSGMVGYTKTLPALSDSPEYLRSWLMGYFAADGSVSSAGQVQISSAVLENLLHVRDVATVLGIGTYAPAGKLRKGYGDEESVLHTMDFVAADLGPDFFLRDDHRARVKPDRDARFGWTVYSVVETDKEEPVYCARVHGTDSFVLEDNIHTGNCPFCGSGQVIATSDGGVECEFCHASFTVQVQPQYPAFPQTMDGGPVNVPGMGPDFSPYGGTPPGQEAPVPMDGEQGGDEEDDGDPMGPNADETQPPEEDDDEEGPSGPPANITKKTYLTATGAILDYEGYLKHLALNHTRNSGETLRRVRASNEAR